MNQSAFDFGEFMEPKKTPVEEAAAEVNGVIDNTAVDTVEEELEEQPEELDVQKAVVESLAADKAALDCEIDNLKKALGDKEAELTAKNEEIAAVKEQLAKNAAELAALKTELAKKETELANNFERLYDVQDRNPNALALLDRDVELPDRFPGESRDHVIEVIKEARDKAEAEGRRRRAQILESVLVANEPNGTLTERRTAVEKVFAENNNVISGIVIEKLSEFSLSHKEGEEYLLPSEIILRNF